MTHFIKNYIDGLPKKTREWAWFILLWVSGVSSVLLISLAVKLLMKL